MAVEMIGSYLFMNWDDFSLVTGFWNMLWALEMCEFELGDDFPTENYVSTIPIAWKNEFGQNYLSASSTYFINGEAKRTKLVHIIT